MLDKKKKEIEVNAWKTIEIVKITMLDLWIIKETL